MKESINKTCGEPVEFKDRLPEAGRESIIINTLVAIQSSEYDVVKFQAVDMKGEEVSFSLYQHDGADYGKSFHFANAYEAEAFATRMLEALNGYI